MRHNCLANIAQSRPKYRASISQVHPASTHTASLRVLNSNRPLRHQRLTEKTQVKINYYDYYCIASFSTL